ncbi:MAG: GIY-YIG nuclease family protein [Actinomycetia bacterium]|nr:GIY-YIG nuclease family protein [Actinomycetes bacterium]
MDLTSSVLYFGSPTAAEQIASDHGLDRGDFTFTIRKEILWESESATDAEVRAKENELIVATGANNPAIGYNRTPRYKPGS